MDFFNVTEGSQGIHRFFTTSLRWGQLDKALVFPQDLKHELDEDGRMQRGINKSRLADLADYLTEAPDHFFSALTLVILPRDLERPAQEPEEDGLEGEWDFYFEKTDNGRPSQQRTGRLYLSGDVRLFPADGQHRAMSARNALKKEHELAREEVPVVLVPYRDPDQVRQMFSDLNLNAKPVSKTIGYDFDTRSPLPLTAKSLAATIPLFKGRVNRVTNSLPRSSDKVITLSTLVQGTRSIAKGLVLAEERIKDPKVDAKAAESLISSFLVDEERSGTLLQEAWSTIVDPFNEYWESVIDETEGAAGALRDTYVFPHGLGWQALAEAVGTLIARYPDDWQRRFRNAVATFDWHREADEWNGNAVIHDPLSGTNRVNNTGPGVHALADKIVTAAEA
jgi:DGQHR domain-containing protein